MSDKIRADIALVQQKLCESRERAQAAIMEGRVFLGDRRINKPSESIGIQDKLILKTSQTEYVSRGALKLEKAVNVFSADLQDRVIMDIGSSTGGFTDVCLHMGARKVYSIDVGYGQLDWKLRNDPRVVVMERTNARYLEKDMFPETPEITVMDVSFISIRLILPAAAGIMGDDGVFYTLIKPQFEAGKEKVGKKGVVRDPAVHLEVVENIVAFSRELGFAVRGLTFSPVKGPEGNIEYLVWLCKGRVEGNEIEASLAGEVVQEAHAALDK